MAERYGEQNTEQLIVFTLSDLAAYFNFKTPFTPRQIKQTAELIFTEFQHFTPEDFKRCFNNIKLMKYGELYQSLDGGKIITMMRQYDADFVTEEAEYRKRKAEERRNEKIEWQPEVTNLLKQTLLKEKVKENNKPMKPTESDNLTKKFLNEFDDLFTQTGESISGMKFVQYKQSKHDRNGYLLARLKEEMEAKGEK